MLPLLARRRRSPTVADRGRARSQWRRRLTEVGEDVAHRETAGDERDDAHFARRSGTLGRVNRTRCSMRARLLRLVSLPAVPNSSRDHAARPAASADFNGCFGSP